MMIINENEHLSNYQQVKLPIKDSNAEYKKKYLTKLHYIYHDMSYCHEGWWYVFLSIMCEDHPWHNSK